MRPKRRKRKRACPGAWSAIDSRRTSERGEAARSRPEPRHLFDDWEEVASRVRAAKPLALLLDFDGTLVDLRKRPGQAHLGEPERRMLGRLASHPRVFVAVISGRALADIRRRVGLSGVRYLGLFGWEREGGRVAVNGQLRRRMEQAKMAARAALRNLPGVLIEDKGLSFAVHFRGATRAVSRKAGRLLRFALRPFGADLRVISGKRSWEILPSVIRGKGEAVRALLARLPESTLAIYAGDDGADESAFRALRRGITLRVGKSTRTSARFRLRNPQEVLKFLQKLEEQLPCGPPSHSTL